MVPATFMTMDGGLVLIPLISGLVFGRPRCGATAKIGLNPFDFRAGIWSDHSGEAAQADAS